MMDLEPSSTVSPDPLEPQSSDDGPQDSGILSSTTPPTGTMPTEATGTWLTKKIGGALNSLIYC